MSAKNTEYGCMVLFSDDKLQVTSDFLYCPPFPFHDYMYITS